MMLVKMSPTRSSRCVSPFWGCFPRRDAEQEEQNIESQASWSPSTDIYDSKEGYVVKMELPGVAKEDVNVEFKDNVLTITGERKDKKEVSRENYYNVESYDGKFYRSFRFPDDVDAQKIDASMKNGVLELRVAKPEERKPRNIPITIH